MVRQKNIITIDGPSGTGKSSVAKAVASRLGYRYLDTGAMYRALTLAAVEKGCSLHPPDVAEISRLVEQKCLTLDQEGKVHLFGKPVDARIRSDAVTGAVSNVAALEFVRSHLVHLQRCFAEHGNVVAEGRDLGSVVYPDAAFKFYLDASPEERARRRAKQVSGTADAEPGAVSKPDIRSGTVDEKTILADQERRDRIDSSRSCSPLIETNEMIRIDTTDMTEEEVKELIIDHVLKALA